jgi:hypothetical protein
MDTNTHLTQLKAFFVYWNAQEAHEILKKIVYAALTGDELNADERAHALTLFKKIKPALLAAEMLAKGQ